jgi:hypothetical protein
MYNKTIENIAMNLNMNTSIYPLIAKYYSNAIGYSDSYFISIICLHLSTFYDQRFVAGTALFWVVVCITFPLHVCSVKIRKHILGHQYRYWCMFTQVLVTSCPSRPVIRLATN